MSQTYTQKELERIGDSITASGTRGFIYFQTSGTRPEDISNLKDKMDVFIEDANEQFRRMDLKITTLEEEISSLREEKGIPRIITSWGWDTADSNFDGVTYTINSTAGEWTIPISDISILEMGIEEAKPLVEQYITSHLRRHDQVYPSDVSEALNLDYDLVVEVFNQLESERKLRGE